jgi:hypothetical protein
MSTNLYTEELESINWHQQTMVSSSNFDFFTASCPHVSHISLYPPGFERSRHPQNLVVSKVRTIILP